MPKTTVTTQATTELNLSATVKAELRTKLYRYTELQREIKEREAEQATLKAEAEAIALDNDLAEELLAGIDVDGIKVKLVEGYRSDFDRKLFASLGGDLDLVDAATVKKANKAYVKITAPKERE